MKLKGLRTYAAIPAFMWYKIDYNAHAFTAQTCFYSCTNSVRNAHFVFNCTIKKPWGDRFQDLGHGLRTQACLHPCNKHVHDGKLYGLLLPSVLLDLLSATLKTSGNALTLLLTGLVSICLFAINTTT